MLVDHVHAAATTSEPRDVLWSLAEVVEGDGHRTSKQLDAASIHCLIPSRYRPRSARSVLVTNSLSPSGNPTNVTG
jgi:hypothetical protein